MAATFLMLLLLVQVATAMTARSAADAAVAATAREASLPGADLESGEARLADAISAMVPGAGDVAVDVDLTGSAAVARASFLWTPPGPVLGRFTISVQADVPRVFEP
ncbi:MAG TPA: hypothetical protein VK960_02590 [Acidimicrobiia bacterium]|nr:hypothetical protein [Acidimicrobiia bacterium]